MARNKLSDLNDHLFAQIEKLADDDIAASDEDIKKAQVIAKLADQVVKTHKLVLDAARTSMNMTNEERKRLPPSFGIEEKA